MPPVRLCRCGDPEDYHHVRENGTWYCAGRTRINEAHPDTEPCACRGFDPVPGEQGRMM